MKNKVNYIFILMFFVINSVSAHYRGEQYQGGIVFWVDEAGEHGLISAAEDLNAELPWFNGNYIITKAFRDGVFAGRSNTNLIAEVQGETIINYAARVVLVYNGAGYNDWYLPSKYELNLMYKLRDVIGGFSDHFYWSSTELMVSPLLGACVQHFGNGDQFVSLKEKTGSVRAIRSF